VHYILTRDKFQVLLSVLSKEADIFAPVKTGAYLNYKKFDDKSDTEYTIDEIRATEPVKSFFTRSREKVDTFKPAKRKQVLIGVKNCDLASLAIQDFVFKNNDPIDPFYVDKRENTLIISSDCNRLSENCFCVALDINPHPDRGFDLNLTKEADDFVVECGSKKGEEVIENNKALFQKASETALKNKAAGREEFKNSLKSQVREKGVPEAKAIVGSVKKSYGATEIWDKFASTCIECGGCNHCCPACHCFFLSDQKKDDLKARYKSWDACLYNRYAVVAGGATPRKYLYERLRNRFDKKFEFFQNVMGVFGCTGCGRCTEVCPGKIDIKEVLKKVAQAK